MHPVTRFLSLFSALTFSHAVAAWQTVAGSAQATADIDPSRIVTTKDGKRAAWTRLAFAEPRLDFEGRFRYDSVEALQHFDCAGGAFVTRQRIYRLDGREMKSEKVSAPRQMVASAEEAKLFAAVCGVQPSVGVARPMHAELVTAGNGQAAATVKVAEPPAAPPSRPRFFEVPIDKSKAEDPYKSAPPAAAPPARAETPAATAPAAAPTAERATRNEAKPTDAAAAKPAPAPIRPELSRLERERLLATSGPRRVVKPKPAEAEPSHEPVHVHWGYAGPGGPEHWGKLKPEYAVCATGKRQSPIDIRGAIKVDLEPIQFDYKPTQFRITDNGHTIAVEVAEGNRITLTGKTYELQQIHFHRPSEERINGKSYDMVAHFVHKSFEGERAVLAVLMEKGAEHPQIQTLWNYMPLEVGMSVEPPGVVLDLAKLLPERREYYTYLGSLTTPPCSEGVLWLVLKQPIAVSAEQIAIFARLYPMNARPVQPTNNRLIKESR